MTQLLKIAAVAVIGSLALALPQPADANNGQNSRESQDAQKREAAEQKRLRERRRFARKRAREEGRATTDQGAKRTPKPFDKDQIEDINLTAREMTVNIGELNALDRQIADFGVLETELESWDPTKLSAQEADAAEKRDAERRRLRLRRRQLKQKMNREADKFFEAYGLSAFDRMLPGANFNGKDSDRALMRQPCGEPSCGIYSLQTLCCDINDSAMHLDPKSLVREARDAGLYDPVEGMTIDDIAQFARQNLKLKARAKRYDMRREASKALDTIRNLSKRNPPVPVVVRITGTPTFASVYPEKYGDNPTSSGTGYSHFVAVQVKVLEPGGEPRVLIGDPEGYRYDVSMNTFMNHFTGDMLYIGPPDS